MYHDLRRDDDFPNWLRVPVSEFDRQLDWLGRVGRFVGPEQLARPQDLPRGVPHFLLTFDDGYVNNLELARPLLERHRAPALFFVSTEHLETGRPFWFDEVVTVVQAGGLAELDLAPWGLGRFRFRPGPADRRWDDIQALLTALKAQGDADDPAVAAVLEDLRRRHGGLLAEHLPRFRPLAAAEVAALDRDPWCTVASHAHRHAVLTRLPAADLDDGLRRSRRILEDLCGREVRDLAYPNGDHDARVEAAARAAGYERGYTVAPGLAGSRTPPLCIPRLGVDGVGAPWLLRWRLVRLLAAAAA